MISILSWFRRVSLALLILIGGSFAGSLPGQAVTDTCLSLLEPFDALGQLILENAENPPEVQLCHRARNAEKHVNRGAVEKGIAELKKFIAEAELHTPSKIPETNALVLINEANRLIELLSGNFLPGKITGGVFFQGTTNLAGNSTLQVLFLSSGFQANTTADENGFFSLSNLPTDGAFVISANDGMGATGSTQGGIVSKQPETSVAISIDQPGPGSLTGQVTKHDGNPAFKALVQVIFPETERTVAGVTDVNGLYAFDSIAVEGTAIVIAYDPSDSSSASESTVISAFAPNVVFDIILSGPPLVNEELVNSDFSIGLEGWTAIGPAAVVDRNLHFTVPGAP